MREVKFRAWDTKKNKWWNPFTGTDFLKPYYPTVSFGLEPKKHIVLQQYTGLKDKNGREIYEGDIIKVIMADGTECIMKLLWDEDRARFNLVDDSWWSFTKDNDMEVIGNIYENPELLKETSNDANKL